MADHDESQLLNQTIPQNNLNINENGDVYVNSTPYSMEARANIVKIIEDFKVNDPECVMKVAGCSSGTTKKIVKAPVTKQNIKPQPKYKNKSVGLSSEKGHTAIHEGFILWLRFKDIYRTYHNYYCRKLHV